MDLRSFRIAMRLCILAVVLSFVAPLVAQQEKPQQPAAQKPAKSSVVFPDEYADLDDNGNKLDANEVLNQRLEIARQYYLKGLGHIERGDTANATRYFESAIAELNKLASTPGIEQNEDYTDLAQSIIEDYESYIRSFENLGENSPLFILRERIFAEVERSQSKANIFPLNKSVEQPSKGTSPLMTTIPLTQNEYVSRCIDFLSSEKGRKYFSHWIERTTRWFPMLRQIAKQENMPEEIIHLAMIESALNPKAVSRASAVGMWQFIQSTGELYNLRVNPWTDDRRDPEKATRAAMRHLRDLNNELGNWHLALAAYNCGINGVKRAMKASGVENPDFWAIRSFLPRETREYVPMFIAATLLTMQHEAYGFKKSDLNFEAEFKCDTVQINEAISLKAVATCAGVTVDEIKNLNTDLLRFTTPPDRPYVLKIPVGLRSTFRDNLADLTPEQKLPWLLHEVKRGETLAMIAASYNAPASEISSANDLGGRKAKMRPGLILRIPLESVHTPKVSEGSENLADNSQKTNNDTEPATDSTQSPKTKSPTDIVPQSKSKAIVHTVSQQGETLYSIANRYGVRLTDLRNWNNLPFDNNSVLIGQKIVVYAPTSSTTPSNIASSISQGNSTRETGPVDAAENTSTQNTTVATAVKQTPIEKSEKVVEQNDRRAKQSVKGVIHKVARGETLAQIADDYNTTIAMLSKLNNLKARKPLLAGQRLQIPTSGGSDRLTTKQVDDDSESLSSTLKMYKVRRGDNIGTIAGEFGVRESQLKTWNPRLADRSLLAGEKLKIYVPQSSKGSAQATPRSVNKVAKYYTAKSGDTMYRIARKYGIDIDKLMTLNKSGDAIRAGQRIRLQ